MFLSMEGIFTDNIGERDFEVRTTYQQPRAVWIYIMTM